MNKDDQLEGQITCEPEGNDPSSPVESSSTDVSDVVIWSSEESGDSDGFTGTAKAMLDFRSQSFSPLLALRCSSTEDVPVAEGTKKYLNLQQYTKAVKSPSKTPRKEVASLRKQASSKDSSAEEPKPSSSTTDFPIPGRRFLPHQLPVFRPRREHPNTITLMNTVEGPLSVLKRVMTERARVKIWTRADMGFRGFLTGFVEAFDKHWNIALRDVDEQFVRKKVIKFPIIAEDNMEEIGEGKDNDKAISSAFIRLKNYLRQNDRMGKRMGLATKEVKNSDGGMKRRSSKAEVTTKSKPVYVGDMDPLRICRTGLANLSLGDDKHHKEQLDASSKTNISKRPGTTFCHQSGDNELSVVATTLSQQNISKASLRKKESHGIQNTVCRQSWFYGGGTDKKIRACRTSCRPSAFNGE